MNAGRVKVVDSHTAGEPTRVIIAGGPELGHGSVAEKLAIFREQHDGFRRAVITEPRGSDVLVGALLVKPSDASCATGVIYFDNACCLGMCGHGTSARLACLAADGRLAEGDALTQQSIIGSTFRGSYRWLDRTRGVIEPTITGTAFITAEAELVFDERDPYRSGIPPLGSCSFPLLHEIPLHPSVSFLPDGRYVVG